MPELELLAVLGSLAVTLATLASIAYWLGRKFEAIDKRFERLELGLRLAVDGLKNAVVSINTMLVEFLGLKGLITPQEVSFLSAEARRLASSVTYVNPLKKEDVEFLKEVFSKDPEAITIEEAERVAEIGKKWWLEEGEERAYRLFLIGTFIKAYHLPKKYGMPR